MRRSLLIACTCLIPLPAAAQDRSLWELVHPDLLLEQFLGQLVVAARSQLDLRYSNLDVSLGGGIVSIDDLELTLYDNITGGDVCDLTVDAVELRTGDPFDTTRMDVQIALRGVIAQPSCLPAPARPGMAVLGLTEIAVPDATVTVDYDLPSGAATVNVTAQATDVVALSLDADFDYVTIWSGDTDVGAPEVSGDLTRATLVLDNLGGWERIAPLLPPSFTDPETAQAAAAQMLGGMADGLSAEPTSKAVKAMVLDAAEGWAAFTADPARLVVETGFEASEPLTLDPGLFEDGPLVVLEEMMPVVRSAPAAEAEVLPRGLVARVLSAPEDATPEDRLRVGLALLTGRGAPRAPSRGAEVLGDLVETDGIAAQALAETLAATDPEAAYAAALSAGGRGASGLRALLDRIEADLPFATRLRLQDGLKGLVQETAGAPTSELRARAEAHLIGTTAPRSLPRALFLASLAAARGDSAAERLLARIDRAVPADGREVWAREADEVADAALDAWLDAR